MHINARDMARFGYLFLRYGKWEDTQIISRQWIDMARTPGSANPRYGYMNWFLNGAVARDDGQVTQSIPAAPETAVTFRGAGSNVIYIDWENDLVVVVRWIGSGSSEFFEKVLLALDT